MANASTPCTLIICLWADVIQLLFLNKSIFFKKTMYRENKNKKQKRAYSQPTGAASLDPDDILLTSSQISRQSLFSLSKFRYLEKSKLDEIMVYDDFECTS